MKSRASQELLDACIGIIESYEPKRTTVDAHCDASPYLKKCSEVDEKFIKQVFYGCTRYQKFLRIYVTGFLYKNPATAQRSDQTLYTVLAYLLIFRLKELGKAEFRKFILCASPPAMLAFLQFASSPKDLNEWVKMEWCKLYDIEYIEHDIIGTLQELLPPDDDLINEISVKATGASIKEDHGVTLESKKQFTMPEPFQLTQPKPRLVPEPMAILREVKAGKTKAQVREECEKKSLATVVAQKEKRRAEVAKVTVEKYADPSLEFNLQTVERAADIDRLRDQYEREKYAECSFEPLKAKPYRKPTQHAEVKMNKGSVLREDALLRSKQDKEYAILKEYESDLRDCSQFYEWQYNQRVKDQFAEQTRIEQRKVEMKMCREEAVEAQAAQKFRNKMVAQQQKEDTLAALDCVELEKQEDLKRAQQLAKDVQAERINPRLEEEKILRAREVHAESLRKQKEVDFERVRKEQEYEMAKKKDLIRQIRALERVSVVRPVPFDPSEPPRHGMLDEMSFAELRERLSMIKAKVEREREAKRLEIIAAKNLADKDLLEKAGVCAKIREQAKVEAQERHKKAKQRAAEEERQKQIVRERCVLQAQEKIASKKKQRLDEEKRLQRELKEISTKRQFLQANAEMVEMKAYEEQQKGLEREARVRQQVAVRDQVLRDDIGRTELKIRRANRVKDMELHKKVQKGFDQDMELARIDDEAYTAEIRNANKTAREFQKRVEGRLLVTQRRDQPYAAKINDRNRSLIEQTRLRNTGSSIGLGLTRDETQTHKRMLEASG
jgi:hypothetical protein